MAVAVFIFGLVALGCGARVAWRSPGWRRWLLGGLLIPLGALTASGGGYWMWFTHRGQPPAVREEAWGRGVTYSRVVLQRPRLMVAHVVRIDLRAEGLGFVVTPPDGTGPLPLKARTTTRFAAEHGARVAVNANFFEPFRTRHPLDYFPHEGDAVGVVGTAASRGAAYGTPAGEDSVLYLSERNEASFGPPAPADGVWNAVAGLAFLVRDGAVVTDEPMGQGNAVHPRVAAALDRERRHLLLVVVDGKQPSYSEGATVRELSELVRGQGGHTAILLDGGGSATLVRRDADGVARVVNSLSNYALPWWERPVANHLGVVAEPLAPPPN